MWTHWKEDGTAYVSFRSYLEHEVAGLEAWYPSQNEVRALIDGLDETFSRRMHRLQCVASEDALPLLECIAAGRREAYVAVRALGRIGTPAALEALVEVGSSRSQTAIRQLAIRVLANVDPATAADIYARHGDFDGLRHLGDARAVPLAVAAVRDGTDSTMTNVAVGILGRSRDVQHIPTLLDAYPRAVGLQSAVIASALHDLGAPEGERYLRELAATPRYGDARYVQLLLDRIERQRQPLRP